MFVHDFADARKSLSEMVNIKEQEKLGAAEAAQAAEAAMVDEPDVAPVT